MKEKNISILQSNTKKNTNRLSKSNELQELALVEGDKAAKCNSQIMHSCNSFTTPHKCEHDSISEQNPFFDIKYICQSATLITESIQKGFDIAQMPNGDITVTEIKRVDVHYNWDSVKQKFIKIN